MRAYLLRRAARALLALALGWLPLAHAGDLAGPLILVAKPQLTAPLYRSTVLVVTPAAGTRASS